MFSGSLREPIGASHLGYQMPERDPDNIVAIALRLADGTFEQAEIWCWDNDPIADKSDQVLLRLQFQGRSLQARDRDAFHAFCALRCQLEPERISPWCYGASKNVYPSGMCLDMGQGYVAYKLRFGDYGRTANLVSIFDAGDDVEPATVQEQSAFYQQWLASLPGSGRSDG